MYRENIIDSHLRKNSCFIYPRILRWKETYICKYLSLSPNDLMIQITYIGMHIYG